MRIFGSVQPESESTVLFQYNIRFKMYQSFDTRSSTPGGDRHVRLHDFFVRNLIPNNFYLKYFLI